MCDYDQGCIGRRRKDVRDEKSRGVINLILTVVVICLLGFTSVVGFGATGAGAAKILSLDLTLPEVSALHTR